MALLGVNIDHVATVRQARGENFPQLLLAADVAVDAGADGITAHLREDRRHIQDADIRDLQRTLKVPLNMEMSISPEIVRIALDVKPAWACLVPERREELTTEGGLDVRSQFDHVQNTVLKLKSAGIRVSLFVEADPDIIQLCKQAGADAVEIHTGRYSRIELDQLDEQTKELDRIRWAAAQARDVGLLVNAGHGLNYGNITALSSTFDFNEFNIGFSIIARAMFVGLGTAVAEMKVLINKGKTN